MSSFFLEKKKKKVWGRYFYFQKSLTGKLNPRDLEREINKSDTRASMSWKRSVAEIHFPLNGLRPEYHRS